MSLIAGTRLAASATTLADRHEESQARLSVTVLSPGDVEVWDELARDGTLTPYQTRAWVEAYARTVLAARGDTFRVLALRDTTGATVALLPLAIQRVAGLRIASFVGDKHANFHMPLFARGVRLDAGQMQRALADAAPRLGGIDAYRFIHQPVAWNGWQNPLALLNPRPSPSNAYLLRLSSDCEATMAAAMSSHARKKQKNKRTRFLAMGESRLLLGQSPAERARIRDVFLTQKAKRFAAMGVPDPFADPAVRAFIREGSEPVNGTAALKLAALELNGQLVSTYVGCTTQTWFSGMATSFEPGEELAKISPGELLLLDLIRLHCRAGFAGFDLGVGEARYKSTICNETIELVDSVIGVSAQGRAFCLIERQARRLQRWIKRQPLAYRVANRLRGLKPQPAADPSA
jgi:CelD/BcsL family acetyltransferase involved in cellulose biosynthesis